MFSVPLLVTIPENWSYLSKLSILIKITARLMTSHLFRSCGKVEKALCDHSDLNDLIIFYVLLQGRRGEGEIKRRKLVLGLNSVGIIWWHKLLLNGHFVSVSVTWIKIKIKIKHESSFDCCFKIQGGKSKKQSCVHNRSHQIQNFKVFHFLFCKSNTPMTHVF